MLLRQRVARNRKKNEHDKEGKLNAQTVASMDQDESADQLLPLLGFVCGYCSCFTKYPDFLGLRLQGNLLILELESECCRPTNGEANPHLKKDDSSE